MPFLGPKYSYKYSGLSGLLREEYILTIICKIGYSVSCPGLNPY